MSITIIKTSLIITKSTAKKLHLLSSLLLIPFILLTLLISGCSHRVKQYTNPEINIIDVQKIAVLPLDNLTPHKYADKKIAGVLIMDLLSRGIDVIEPGEVNATLKTRRVRSSTSLPVTTIKEIGKSLKVDAVIFGSVSTFEMQKGITVSYPEASIYLTMIDVRSGDIIWSAWHTSGGASFWSRHFGSEGATLDETARVVVKEVFDTVF
jgi:PBP1b-binding outer membrane lipoprotein LpoB